MRRIAKVSIGTTILRKCEQDDANVVDSNSSGWQVTQPLYFFFKWGNILICDGKISTSRPQVPLEPGFISGELLGELDEEH